MGCGKGKKKGKGKGKGLTIALAVVVSLISTSAIAAPFAVTATFPTASVSKCMFVLNSGAVVTNTPIVNDATTSYCAFDVAASQNGNNVLSVQYGNIWGVSTAVPFSYAKSLPPLPSGMALKESI